MKRVKWLFLFLLCCISLVLILITSLRLAASAETTTTSPIKIGILVPQTGPLTELGNEIKAGLTIAFDEVGWKIAGREIKLIIEDTEAKPPVALQKVRKLVESDRVDVLAGVVHSGVAIALRDYVDEHKIPLIISTASADILTREKASKYIFRTSYSSRIIEGPMAPYAYTKLGIRTVYIIANDYVTGRERSGWFKRFFEQLGGKVAGEVFVPLGTNDFGPYLARIKDVDALWAFLPGSDGIQFVKQYDEFGLKKKMPLIGASATYEGYQLEAQKDSALGSMCSSAHAVALNIPENKNFLKAYFKISGGRDPDIVAVGAYVAGGVIIEGIKNTKGNTQDVPSLLESFRKVRLITPRGPFRFDEKQNPICDIFIEKVVKREGRYTRDLIYTYSDIHQDWTP